MSSFVSSGIVSYRTYLGTEHNSYHSSYRVHVRYENGGWEDEMRHVECINQSGTSVVSEVSEVSEISEISEISDPTHRVE